MATDKAKYITGFTKIVRTAANKAANDCECCGYASIDVFFYDLDGCVDTVCPDTLNGNTFTVPYNGHTAGSCVWDYYVGTTHIIIYLNDITGVWSVVVAINDGGWHWCFRSDSVATGCDAIPLGNQSNIYTCGSYHSVNGKVDLSWT